MDRDTRARVEEAKRELDDILTSLAGRRRHHESAGAPYSSVVFVGPVIIHRLVLDTYNREEVT